MASSRHGIGKSVHSPDQAALCALLIEARKDAGLTQQTLADKLRKPQSFVAKYEGGERRLDVLEFIAIVRSIGADPLKMLTKFLLPGKSKRTRQG